MKSSTIKRSSLTKETMNVIENLSREEKIMNMDNENYTQYNDEDRNLEEYTREGEPSRPAKKYEEIDLLWRSFKSVQFSNRSPMVYLVVGFLLGIIVSVGMLAMTGTFKKPAGVESAKTFVETISSENKAEEANQTIEESILEEEASVPPVQESKKAPKTVKKVNTPKETTVANTTETTISSEKGKTIRYVVKNGDTVENIIRKTYGSYSPERAEAIKRVNNMSSLDRISIDQVILLPVEE